MNRSASLTLYVVREARYLRKLGVYWLLCIGWMNREAIVLLG